MSELARLETESRNPRTINIDRMTTEEIVRLINQEDMSVACCVQKVIPEITAAVEAVYEALANNGRLFYVGAGTSGRIGVMDAVECPPTFSTPPELVQAVIAGGADAFGTAAEGVEDNTEAGAADLRDRGVTKGDVVVGIAASGRTPYVLGALQYAKDVGAVTISLTSNKDSVISQVADIKIEVVTGPEVISGSTRMKAATAHKMVLNMISTSAMIKLGKVYENLMVDLKVSNHKLRERAIRIVETVTQRERSEVEVVLAAASYQVKPALVMMLAGVDFDVAQDAISRAKGHVRRAIELLA